MKWFKSLRSGRLRYYSIIAVLGLILTIFKVELGLLVGLGLGVLVIRDRSQEKSLDEEMSSYVNSIKDDFDQITKHAIFSMPFPMVILDQDRKVKWFNTLFRKEAFPEKESQEIIGIEISALIAKDDLQTVDWEAEALQKTVSKLGGTAHQLYIQPVINRKGEKRYLLYAVDLTDYHALMDKHKNQELVVMLLFIDNYEDWNQGLGDNQRAMTQASVERLIFNSVQDRGGFIRKYDTDKYLAIMDRKGLDLYVEERFRILDAIRELDSKIPIPPTFSIGVGMGGQIPFDKYESARVAVDIALGRGGDQAVVKDEQGLQFFGGKKPAKEKSNKVRARVVSHAIARLITESENVFVMGHKYPDMDSFGACLGIWQAAQNLGKEAYVVLSDVTPPIKNIYAKTTQHIAGLKNTIIKPERALEMARSESLIVVVDNHRRGSTEEPKLLDISDRIVMIDHHRRGSDYIQNTALTYLETYASSASELVTEILYYMTDEVKINKHIAEALLAGITVDTKNFVQQTGVRTFESAAILKRHGADSIEVKNLFKEDFDILKYKSQVINEALIFKGRFAIGRFGQQVPESNLIASQAADDLLNIQEVDASFVLTRIDDKTHISARSLGGVSVQLIMERLGGGGHLTAAATQVQMGLEDAENLLKKAIRTYIKEEEKR